MYSSKAPATASWGFFLNTHRMPFDYSPNTLAVRDLGIFGVSLSLQNLISMTNVLSLGIQHKI